MVNSNSFFLFTILLAFIYIHRSLLSPNLFSTFLTLQLALLFFRAQRFLVLVLLVSILSLLMLVFLHEFITLLFSTTARRTILHLQTMALSSSGVPRSKLKKLYSA